VVVTPAPRAANTPVRVKVTAAATVVAAVPRRPASRDARSHVVEAGESLWSIASDILGDGASSGQIAREVERLWERNRQRIGTGDRDVVMAGTLLRLA
jgi:nucleoid-associated protein YgaU